MISGLLAFLRLIAIAIAPHPAQGIAIPENLEMCHQVEITPSFYVVSVAVPVMDEDAYGPDLLVFEFHGTYNIISFLSQDPDEMCTTIFSLVHP